MWRVMSRDDVPQFLDSLDLPGVAKYMKSESCKNIFVMAGAGISTSAGIPDFRSPDTGLYANLARLNLPYPEAVFDISFFKRNPRPFYVLAHELAPGKFRPTLTHSFIRLLNENGHLHTCFTQNIDTLERVAGVPGHKIVEAHGSFANQHCVKCGAPYPHDKIEKKIEDQEIPICERRGCGGFVKPDIVFFGESLPDEFFRGIRHLTDADLLIVMGTSLTVHPFASLTELVPEECPRLLLNLDHVGGWGSRANDIACLMPCDRAIRELCRLLGWEEELDALWAETDPSPKKQIAVSADKTVKPKPSEEDKVEETSGKIGKVEGEKEGKEEREDAEPAAEQTKTGEVEEAAGKGRVEGAKHVNEELLANVIDKLAETISEVRLEDEEKSKRQDRAVRGSDEDTASTKGQILPEPAKTGEKSDNSTEMKEDSWDATEKKEPENPPDSGEKSNTENSKQTGKL